MTDADGELQETQHWIGTAYDCGYWDQSVAGPLREHGRKIGRLLGSMIDKADQFCSTDSPTLRELPVEYVAGDLADEVWWGR